MIKIPRKMKDFAKKHSDKFSHYHHNNLGFKTPKKTA